MTEGKPVIVGVEGDGSELVLRPDGGVVVPPEQPKALADAVIALSRLSVEELAGLGMKPRQFYCEHLSFALGVDELVALFETIIATKVGGRA